MDAPPSRSSQESRLSTLSSNLLSSRSPSLSSCYSSPRPLSSALSLRSEDSLSEAGFDVQPYLDHLLPCVNSLLFRFDRINQITEDLHDLEVKLEEAQVRRRKRWIRNQRESAGGLGESGGPEKVEGEVGRAKEIRHRKTGVLYPKLHISTPASFSYNPSTLHPSPTSVCILPRARSSYSESTFLQPHSSKDTHLSEVTKPTSGNYGLGLYSAESPSSGMIPRRRAWHSGSSHSADAAQRALQASGGVVLYRNGGVGASVKARPRSEEGVSRHISDGIPVKRKAWISEGPETEQD